jgi:uncharacterized protein YyaL (SSP411 family)
MTKKHQFTNRLINETSPYLLQHAHNPVDWFPWGSEALEISLKEDKPILLSVGYSACHWCHVMEHESFENENIAKLMNDNFVCIKVDREERPDIDAIYMNAVQMMTGHGGWPMTVFLTPALKPFYGGTYYPPVDRQGMPGFPKVLLTIAEAYRSKRGEINNSADEISKELQNMNRFYASNDLLTSALLSQAFSSLSTSFDTINGGFGRAPKFPPSMSLLFLLRYHNSTHSPEALMMVETTLEKMANGGIFDHLGGGFARYSVDNYWLIPHFEKMLYDNALLTRVYLQAYQLTNKPFYRRVAEEILEYIIRDMTDKTGGFYSAEDADSEGEEGKFYVWTKNEVLEILGSETGETFCNFFDITSAGNFEHGKSNIHINQSPEEYAKANNIPLDDLNRLLSTGKKNLFYKRSERIRPGLDNKILTAWNGLMLTTFAEAANILGRDDYREIARRNADFILSNLMSNGRLLRTYKDGSAKLNAYLEDYAYFAEGLLALYEATFESQYFDNAVSIANQMIAYFWDEKEEGFFFTSSDHEDMIIRTKDFFDNAIPSGNSVAALVLQKIALLTGDNSFQQYAVSILRMTQQTMARYPTAFGYMLCALDFYLDEVKEIALVGDQESHEIKLLLKEIYAQFFPNKVVALSQNDHDPIASRIKLLENKTTIDGKPAVYVCRNFTCLTPVTEPEKLAKILGT